MKFKNKKVKFTLTQIQQRQDGDGTYAANQIKTEIENTWLDLCIMAANQSPQGGFATVKQMKTHLELLNQLESQKGKKVGEEINISEKNEGLLKEKVAEFRPVVASLDLIEWKEFFE